MRLPVLIAFFLTIASATLSVSAVEKASETVPQIPAVTSEDPTRPGSEFASDELPVELAPPSFIELCLNCGTYIYHELYTKPRHFLANDPDSNYFIHSFARITCSSPYSEPILTKPLPPFALIPRKLCIAPSGEVFYE
jgi:hypothetical protein